MPEVYELLDVAGNVITLQSPLSIGEVDGLGMPEVYHASQLLAQMDGELYLDSWLRRRVVNISFDLTNVCEAEIWNVREQMVQLMAQFTNGFILRVRLPNGKTRHVDLRYMAGMTLPRSRAMSSLWQPFVLQARTYDNPTLYDPGIVSLFWTLGAGDAGSWFFSLGLPEGFGAPGALGGVVNITYDGSWKTYPVISVGGPGDTILIENTTTGEKLEFDPAYAIVAGEFLTIDLTPGVKTVVSSVAGNVVDQLTDDSDLGTFHIAAAPEAAGGVNSISVTMSNVSAASWVLVEFYNRYVGI